MPLFLVMLGGAFGAGARHLVGRAMLGWLGPAFPWGTLSINIAGSLLMGVLVGTLARFQLGDNWRLFLAVGVLGGFTTFSSFSLDAVTLAERGQLIAAGAYVIASVTVSIAALVAGLAAARSFA
ncbi:CrcB protein [Sphingomonas jinjuensis]|uniref:Fluoride-specific ion channel FluC n=1 Tax=Sphingomonas jinjuensis TaxID=535907 RepID=A0A840FAX7_9SPHN|nr:fluoride efflux transporter CrcB [Sphingomonas jinjuensis]MBB4153792.1 CrcB protein [Sphingomonas jinjuensis]